MASPPSASSKIVSIVNTIITKGYVLVGFLSSLT